MDAEYTNRIAAFIEEYIDILDDQYSYSDDIVIRHGIKKLIEEGAFTREEMKKEALKSYGVFISDELIDRSLRTRLAGD